MVKVFLVIFPASGVSMIFFVTWRTVGYVGGVCLSLILSCMHRWVHIQTENDGFLMSDDLATCMSFPKTL